MAEYETKTLPFRHYYEERGVLVRVDAAAPQDEVADRIFAALDARRPSEDRGRHPSDL